MLLPTAGSHVWGPPAAGLCADLRTMEGLALRGCPLPLPSPFLHSSLAQTVEEPPAHPRKPCRVRDNLPVPSQCTWDTTSGHISTESGEVPLASEEAPQHQLSQQAH